MIEPLSYVFVFFHIQNTPHFLDLMCKFLIVPILVNYYYFLIKQQMILAVAHSGNQVQQRNKNLNLACQWVCATMTRKLRPNYCIILDVVALDFSTVATLLYWFKACILIRPVCLFKDFKTNYQQSSNLMPTWPHSYR